MPDHPPTASLAAVPHVHLLRVRYAETDQMGVVHHGSYVLYLEEARTRMMAADGHSYAQLERAGIGLAVRRIELRYRLPAYYEEELRILTRVARVRGASVLLEYAVQRASNGELVAEASTELACVDLGQKPPRPLLLPDGIRAVFEARLRS